MPPGRCSTTASIDVRFTSQHFRFWPSDEHRALRTDGDIAREWKCLAHRRNQQRSYIVDCRCLSARERGVATIASITISPSNSSVRDSLCAFNTKSVGNGGSWSSGNGECCSYVWQHQRKHSPQRCCCTRASCPSERCEC
jgi:hypothetical protein